MRIVCACMGSSTILQSSDISQVRNFASHRAGLKNMPGHGGIRTYDLWNTSPIRPDRVAQLAEHWASIPKVVGSNPTVARHIFQACPVWIYTQSNITQASYFKMFSSNCICMERHSQSKGWGFIGSKLEVFQPFPPVQTRTNYDRGFLICFKLS